MMSEYLRDLGAADERVRCIGNIHRFEQNISFFFCEFFCTFRSHLSSLIIENVKKFCLKIVKIHLEWLTISFIFFFCWKKSKIKNNIFDQLSQVNAKVRKNMKLKFCEDLKRQEV